jgi:propanol-preferring alcohol dehydrogenase
MVGDHLKKGDVIGIPWLHSSCLHCDYCLTGRETLCKQQTNSGYSSDGCFAEYALMDANFAVKLPEGMDPYKSAPLYCAGVTVYKALKVSNVRPGEWVSIVGVGGLGKRKKFIQKLNRNFSIVGSVAVEYAVAMGMRVVTVVAPNDQVIKKDLTVFNKKMFFFEYQQIAVQLSKDMGAEEVFDGPADQHGKWIQEKVGGVHGSVVTVPIVAAFEQAFQSVRRGGRVVAVALPSGKMTIPIVDCVLGGIELVGSVVGTRKDLQEALEIAKLHHIECKVQKRKLEEINEIFDEMVHYKISGRVVLDFAAK